VFVAIAFAVVALLAVAAVVATRPPPAPTTGRLSHETRLKDRESVAHAARLPGPKPAPSAASVPVPRPPAPPARRAAPDEDARGVTRRQLLNRSLLAGAGLGLGAFGTAVLAFLWPSAASGFGGKIAVGSTSDVATAVASKQPYYNATAKTYIVPYPKAALPNAKKVSAYTPPIIAGMEAGYVALWQTCPHLGCRVPWCDSSQWFECPCHGSKYNAVGEKQGGPAPRGMDRFVFQIAGGTIVVDTGNLVPGPPIGTDTTGQAPAGAPCV
jgi:cytochrome b6-f complex iron-sulfur subunit